MCEEYLLTFHKHDIINILQDEDATEHFSISINFIVLYEHQPNLVLELLKKPEECLEDWDNATLKAQMSLLKEVDKKSLLKNNVHCRMFHLPGFTEVRRTVFPGNDDAGKFLQVSGTVMRMSASKLLEYQRSYVCVKCKYPMIVKAEYDKKYIIKQPNKCGNPEGCSGKNLISLGELDSENCKDFQEIKIQEQVKKQGVGSMPNTMWVTLEDDLVDSCKPGDSVTICGIVKRRWGEFCKGYKIDIDIVLKANNVQVDNNSHSIAASTPEIKEMFRSFWEKYSGDPLAGRDLILKSFCPQIYGLYLVKLAIAIVLAGGSQIEDTTLTGVRTRSESHLLLIGDPGTGKSQLLRFASKIIPRSVLTTGVGSTAAGLTVTAMMEHGEWQLEGGALVMSDGGICCIDEFNSMKDHDRTSIHEAMEQQTISVAKASIVCKLNTRCSILAACNPKGNLDPTQPLYMNIALPSPLLSRFDLILLLRDVINEEWDTQVSDYILNGGNTFSKLTDSGLWSIDILQSYFMVIKKFNPKLSENAETILSTYYQMQRRIDSRNKARTTVRLLESLVRLSQGHARLMYHEEVETVDSIYAIILVDTVMESDSSILNLNISTHSVFPERPWRDYGDMLELILNKLRLQDILDKEIESLRRNAENGLAENVRSRFFNAPSDNIFLDNFKENINENVPAIVSSERNKNLSEFKENSSQNVRDNDVVVKKDNIQLKTNNRSIFEECNKNKRRINLIKEVPKGAKRIKTTSNPGDSALEIDLDEGYDTVSFISPNLLNSKSRTEQMSNSKERPLLDNSSSSKNERVATSSISSCENEETCDILSKLSKTDVCNSGLGESLVAQAGSSNTPDLEGDNDLVCPKATKMNSENKEIGVLKGNDDASYVNVKPNEQTSNSKKLPHLDCSSSSKNERVATNSVSLCEETVSVLNTKPIPKNDIKSKLNKFKFIPKVNDAVGGNLKITECGTDVLGAKNKAKHRNDFVEDESGRHGIENKTKGQRNINVTGNRLDFVKDDLAMLKLLPSVNDDLKIDIDFDWDNFGQNTSDGCQNTDFSANSKKEFGKLLHKSKLQLRKFPSDKKVVKKPSNKNNSNTIVRADSTMSSQSSKRSIFSTSDENIDDLDLDI